MCLDFCDGCCYRRNCNHDLEKCCYLESKTGECIVLGGVKVYDNNIHK